MVAVVLSVLGRGEASESCREARWERCGKDRVEVVDC